MSGRGEDAWAERLVCDLRALRRMNNASPPAADVVQRMQAAVPAAAGVAGETKEVRQRRVLTILALLNLTDFDSIKTDCYAANGPLRPYFDTLDELQAALDAVKDI